MRALPSVWKGRHLEPSLQCYMYWMILSFLSLSCPPPLFLHLFTHRIMPVNSRIPLQITVVILLTRPRHVAKPCGCCCQPSTLKHCIFC
jgi:hypothetical protein